MGAPLELVEQRWAARFLSFSRTASAAVILIGFLVLVGWAADLEALKSLVPGQVAMNPATALGFILCGASLWQLRSGERGPQHALRVARCCAVLVVMLALLRIGGYAFGRDPYVDQILFRGRTILEENRMAPNTALLFVLVGLQLPAVMDGIEGVADWALVGDGVLLAATVMLVRLAWVFPFTYLPRLLVRRVRDSGPAPPWRHTLLVAWTGMRGAVSLAAALALPLATDAGADFPRRDLIIFLAFSVILGTLLVQGLTLPALIRLLRVDDYDEQLEREESKARLLAVEAALARIDELAAEEWVRDDTAERVRGAYDYRRRRFAARFEEDGDPQTFEERAAAYQRVLRELLDAQRAILLELRNAGHINDEVMRRIERELDLEDSRLEI